MNWSGTRLALKAMGTREGMVFNSSVFREVGRTVATCCPPIPRGHCRGDGGVIMETYSSQHEILGVDQVAPEGKQIRESGQPGKLIVSCKGMVFKSPALLWIEWKVNRLGIGPDSKSVCAGNGMRIVFSAFRKPYHCFRSEQQTPTLWGMRGLYCHAGYE